MNKADTDAVKRQVLEQVCQSPENGPNGPLVVPQIKEPQTSMEKMKKLEGREITVRNLTSHHLGHQSAVQSSKQGQGPLV